MTNVEAKRKMNFERTFLSNHIKKYYRILDGIPATGDVQMDKVHYCERFTELMIDLTAQLPTRRFFNTGRSIFRGLSVVSLIILVDGESTSADYVTPCALENVPEE